MKDSTTRKEAPIASMMLRHVVWGRLEAVSKAARQEKENTNGDHDVADACVRARPGGARGCRPVPPGPTILILRARTTNYKP